MTWSYDATGQQVYVDWPNLTQWYDGDRLRVKKTEGGANTPTYYLRSSVLGGQVVAEINASGSLQRGYVYGAGGGLLAILSGGVSWVYQDAATKSQRVADAAGNVYAGVDVDPWGRETTRGWNQQAQPRRFTTYTRDSNDSDEAMHRRYNRWHLRFDQPALADEGYDLTVWSVPLTLLTNRGMIESKGTRISAGPFAFRVTEVSTVLTNREATHLASYNHSYVMGGT